MSNHLWSISSTFFVVSESLYWRAVGGKRTGTVFEREYSKIALGPSISKASINTSVNPKMPYLSFLAINFTSHDMTTMKNTVFCRDEIWFAAENSNHESEIYSLYEIHREDNERVNSTAAFDKQYMEGRYRATVLSSDEGYR